MARQHDITIVCDEVYRLIEIDPNVRLPPIASVYEKGISISVLTKAYGLGGLRIGWTASQHTPYIHQIAAYKHYTSISNAASSEILALIALRNSEKLLHRNHRITTENLNLVNWLIHSQPLLSWTPPKDCVTPFL